jgi:hypothetical protein
MILTILEELGLVVKEGEAIKIAPSGDMKKLNNAVDLVKADLVKSIAAGDEALAGDVAKLITANEEMQKRVDAVTGFGPVITIPSGEGGSDAVLITQEIEMLKKYQTSAKTPAEAARFGELIAAAEIRQIQSKPSK